ncbi:MAG: zinc-dependent metalloprotease, partial [Saprospiraceae bacterium]|nr:zinc-dependent metalloprotease [Saprospiraceae bacterium]
EIDNDILDSGNCFLPTVAQSTNLENELCAKDYNTCTATIDILVLLPNDARIWLVNRFGGDAFAAALYIGIGTQALNLAFANSDIPNKKVNIILENFEMNYPSVGSTCGQLLTALQAQATARRNAVRADMVVLITATDYPCGSGAATAELGDPPFFGDPSFAFSEIRWLFRPRWSMLHEVGHLMGAGHDRPDDNDSDCAHGWTVGGNRFQRTLMARWVGTQNPTDTRILHYSNPDIVYNGDVTGTDEDNNAKVITKLANIKIFEETDPRCDHKRSPRPEFSHTSILWEKLVAAPNPANTTVQVSWLSNTESNIDLAI